MKKIGIIMLNTDFPRPPGDIGNPASFAYPCEIVRLQQGRVSNIVASQIPPEIMEEIMEAACRLEIGGATLIATSCGFLGPVQAQVQAGVKVPFLASSLVLLPLLQAVYGAESLIGVLTFDSRKLGVPHLMGHPPATLRIAGIEHGQELHRVISRNEPVLDQALALRDVLAASEPLVTQGVRCLLLECTNLSPYKQALRTRLGLPVYDLVDAIHWIAQA